ncbi:MAG TPA: AAA family ATPase [Tepidisphaeraceae bacterium]|jgi:adenylate kinase family enzyme
MRRILIVGCSGSGKSTLARALGERLGLPVIHLDREYWQAGWQPMPAEQFDRRIEEVVAGSNWIIDGNFARSLPPRVARADTIIHLDFAMWRCLWRIARRGFLAHNFDCPRPDMTPGCPEHLDWEFVEWIIRFRRVERPKTLRALDARGPGVSVITLRTPREVRAFLIAQNAPPNDKRRAIDTLLDPR